MQTRRVLGIATTGEKVLHLFVEVSGFLSGQEGYGRVTVRRIVMAGEADKLLASEDIQEFYLGVQGETQRGQKRWKRRKTWR